MGDSNPRIRQGGAGLLKYQDLDRRSRSEVIEILDIARVVVNVEKSPLRGMCNRFQASMTGQVSLHE